MLLLVFVESWYPFPGIVELQPDAHVVPVMASVVVHSADDSRYTVALMNNERIARLLADIDALGEALIAANSRDP